MAPVTYMLDVIMKHTYTRRTYDDAIELAKKRFRELAPSHLTDSELMEVSKCARLSGGSVADPHWTGVLGSPPTDRDFYEIMIYESSSKCPYVKRVFVRMLVPRNRSSSDILFIWKPPVPPYDGPYFT